MNLLFISYIIVPFLTIIYGITDYYIQDNVKRYTDNTNQIETSSFKTYNLLTFLTYTILLVVTQIIVLFFQIKSDLNNASLTGSNILKLIGISLTPWIIVFLLIHVLLQYFNSFKEPFANTFGKLFYYIYENVTPSSLNTLNGKESLIEDIVSKTIWYGLAATITISWAFNWAQSSIVNYTKPIEVIEKEQQAYNEYLQQQQTIQNKKDNNVRKITN